MDPESRRCVRNLFGQLVVPGETGADTRRRILRSQLRDVPDRVVEPFGALRVLTFDHAADTREPTIEIAHEALLDGWPLLGSWLDEDRADLQLRHQIGLAATTWARFGCDDSELLRGGRLDAACELLDSGRLPFEPRDAEYVAASREAHDRATAGLRRTARRLTWLSIGIAAAFVVAVIAGGFALHQRSQARSSASTAETERLAATAGSLATVDTPVAALLAVEAARRDEGAGATAIEHVLTAKPGFLGALPAVGEYAFDTTGSTLVVRSASGLEVYDLATRQRSGTVEHAMVRGMPGRRLAVTDDGIVLETAGDQEIRRYRLPDLAPLESLTMPADVRALDASRSGAVVAGLGNGTVVVADAGSGAERARFSVGSPVTRVSVAADGRRAAVAAEGGTHVYDLLAGTPIGPAMPGSPLDVGLSPDGSTAVVTAPWFATSRVDIDGGGDPLDLPLGLYDRFVDADHVALSTGDAITVVDVETGVEQSRVATTCGCDFAVSGDGTTLATGLDSLGLYALDERGLLRETVAPPPSAPDGAAVDVTVDADASLFGIGWDQGGVRLYRPSEGGLDPLPTGHDEAGRGGVLGDGSMVVLSNDTGTVFDPATGAVVSTFDPGGPVTSFSSSVDGTLLSLGRVDGSVRVVEARTGDTVVDLDDLARLDADNGFPFATVVGGSAFSPDGRLLVASTWSGASGAWDVGDWETFRPLTPSVLDVNGAAPPRFDPSGAVLAVSHGRAGMRLFDGATLSELREVPFGTQGLPTQAAFDPTGTRLAVAFDTGTAVVYDVTDGSTIGAPLPASPLTGLAFVDADTLIVGSTTSPALHVWHLDPTTLTRAACLAVGRNLTRDEWARFGPRDTAYRLTCPEFGEPPDDPTGSVDLPAAGP